MLAALPAARAPTAGPRAFGGVAFGEKPRESEGGKRAVSGIRQGKLAILFTLVSFGRL